VVRAGLLGAGIGYSMSGAIFEEEARQHGFVLQFELLDTNVTGQSPEEALRQAAERGFAGVSITQPYKVRLLPSAHRLETSASLAGSVNTIKFTSNLEWVGSNADAAGFDAQLDALGDLDLSRVVQIGAGGAGASTAIALLARGAPRLVISDLDAERATELVAHLSAQFPGRDIVARDTRRVDPEFSRATGVVNASVRGSVTNPGSPVAAELLRADMWIADVIYAPRESELLRWGRQRGARTMNGERMLVHQAAHAFRFLFDVVPDVGRMWSHFQSLQQERP
jgi:shikimate dehydrogenase